MLEGVRWAALVFAISACSASSPEPGLPRVLASGVRPHRVELPNGLAAVLVPDPYADVASGLVRVAAGAVDDPLGHEGAAHLAAHLSYATVRDGKLTLWDELDAVASKIEVVPGVETTEFSEQCAPGQLADLLRLEARRLGGGCEGVTDDWLAWTRDHVVAETRANTTRAVNAAVAHAIYAEDDPARRGYDATPDGIAALAQQDACDVLAARYGSRTTTVVVTGPLEPAAFDALVTRELGALPDRPPAERRHATAAPLATSSGFANVPVPTVVAAWPLPGDAGERALLGIALDALDLRWFTDAHHVLLWLPATDGDLSRAKDRLRAALHAGLVPAAKLERERTAQITTVLANLDAPATRLSMIAHGGDADAALHALERASPAAIDDVVARDLAWERAQTVDLVPDGSPTRATTLADPPHDLAPPTSHPTELPAPAAPAASRVAAAAKAFRLENGLEVVLVPTSPIPIAEVGLWFRAGSSAEPREHPGTATVAIAALAQLASRRVSSREASWAVAGDSATAELDQTSYRVRGPAIYLDHLLAQFDGLARETFETTDVRRGIDRIVHAPGFAIHRAWDDGPPHGTFDVRAVEAFYRHYFHPDHAVLVVTGGFDVDATAARIRRTFAGWEGTSQPLPAPPAPAPPAHLARTDRNATTVHLSITWPAGGDDAHYAARMLLAQTLDAISPHVHAHYEPARGGGSFTLDGDFDTDTAPTEVRQVAQRLALVAYADARYRPAFLAARMHGTRAALAGPRGAAGWNGWLGWTLAHGHDVAWLATVPARYAAVTYEDIAHLAASELADRAATWTVSGHADAVAASYAAIGIEPTWIRR